MTPKLLRPFPKQAPMYIDGTGGTLPLPFSHNEPAAWQSATLPIGARPGMVRRASSARTTPPARGLGHTLRQFFSGGRRRAGIDARQPERRLAASVKDFVVMWSRRQIDELAPRDGTKLLRIVCMDTLPLGVRVDPGTVGTWLGLGPPAGTDDTAGGDMPAGARPRSDTAESFADSVILPAKPALRTVLRACLAAMEDQAALSLLYNDLAAPIGATRALVDALPARLRPVATGVLDLLEQAVARELALRIGWPLLDALLDPAARRPPAAVRDALEQLHGIGLWLSGTGRTCTQVLDLVLESLNDEALGRLAAQAWPELSASDQRYGADPAAMAAAMQFIEACDGDALRTWRDALAMQLRRRKRRVAARAAENVVRAGGAERMAEAMRAAHAVLDDAARTLAGHLPNVSLLRARIRDEALALVLHRLPDPLRKAGLRALPAYDVSSLRDALNASSDMARVRPAIGGTVDSVQADMLAADRQAVEDALADLHEAVDREDRAAAVAKLGALSHAVQELKATQDAFHVAMPPPLADSLAHAVSCMRGLLGSETGGDAHAARGLSDIELGQLRAAHRPLAPFGVMIDRNALSLEIRVRGAMPFSARERMDRLLDICLDERASVFDFFAGLRDLADVLVRHNRRRAELGEEISADTNEALAYDLVHAALDRLARDDRDQLIRVRQARDRYGIAADTLSDPLYALAEHSASQPAADAADLNRLMAVLTMAGHVQRYLCAPPDAFADNGGIDTRDADTPDDGPARAERGTLAAGAATPGRDDEVCAAMAGEFGVEWDAVAQVAAPAVTSRHRALFRQQLAAPVAGTASRSRSVRLPLGDGEESWFSVTDTFAADMLWRAGMSLAVEGINARGQPVRYPGFDAALDGADRLAAVGAALHALRMLAGDATHGLTRVLHCGLVDAFRTALAALPQDSPLRLPNGTRVLLPAAAQPATDFRIGRQANGHYRIHATIHWRGLDSVVAARPRPGEPGTIALDPARSRVQANFTLAADANGRVTALWEGVDIRHGLVVRDDASGG